MNTTALSGEARLVWNGIRADIETSLRGVNEKTPVEALRTRFEPLSHAMLELAARFGHTRQAPLYRTFCPMAFKNKGAPWLQSGEIIANPYFGHTMLRCGEIQKTFPPADAAESADELEGGDDG